MSTATLRSHRSPETRSGTAPDNRVQDKPTTPKRTTVALSARAAEIVGHLQEAAGISLSEAVSTLIERSEEQPARIKYVNGLPVADIPMDGKWITTEDILQAEAEIW